MDKKELDALIAQGPVRVKMNSGDEFIIPSKEMSIVSDIAASFLYKDPDDGKWRQLTLPLVTMSVAELIEQ